MSETKSKKFMTRKKLGLILVVVVILMFGFGYLMVPIYNVLCSALGLNGKTGGATVAGTTIDKSRTITMLFVAARNKNLKWQFKPLTTTLKVHPGENYRVAFFAENDSGQRMTIQAIPSVTPGLAANYLKKTECFCFTQQTLANGEKADFPLMFHLATNIPKDITTVVLQYTLFEIKHPKGELKNTIGAKV